MKVRCSEGLANHADPESRGGCREASIEALTGETGRPAYKDFACKTKGLFNLSVFLCGGRVRHESGETDCIPINGL
jgi:hypothetical protein